MEPDKDDLKSGLVKGYAEPVADFLCAAADTVLNIPAFTLISTVIKIGLSGRDRFLVEKLLSFFSSYGRLPEEERDKLRSKLDADPAERKRVGETIPVIFENLAELTPFASFKG